MTRRSLLRRVIVSVLLIEFLCAVAFVSTALWHEWRTRFHALDISLEGRSDALIGAVQDAEDPGDHVTVDPSEFTPQRGESYAVFDPTGRLVGTSSQTISPILTRGVDGSRNVRVGDHRYRLLQREALRIIDREETHGVGMRRPVTVLYAASTDHLWHGLVETANFYLLVSVGLLCVTAVVLVVLLQRLLAPLQQLADRAAAIHTDSLTFDAPAGALQVRELVPLAEALSAMVARVRAAFDAQHRFINDAAHELKTAVSVVRSSIQVLGMRSRTPEEYRAGLEQVLTDNERVEQLVHQMLSLARFEEQTEALPVHCDLAEQVQLAVESLRPVAESRGISVRCSLDGGAAIELWPEAARTVASNLILNALQHSVSGSETIVTVQRSASGDLPASLSVQDFGSGIAAENLGRIFERFFREDPSRSRQTGGAGLGLAICKSIVDGAHGTIEVQSQLGKGTVITVSFPAAEPLAQNSSPTEQLHPAARPRS